MGGEYFKNYVDRMNVMIPFLVTDMDRKMNAWCTVEGGGSSGQSGAIREAIAKAVGFYQPTLYPYLHAYKLTTRDWRKKERKKPGNLTGGPDGECLVSGELMSYVLTNARDCQIG